MSRTALGGATVGLGGLAGCLGGDGGSGGGGGDGGGGGGNGGSSGGGGGGGGKSMATITRLSNAYWGSWVKGYKEAAAALGYETNVQLNEGKLSKQIQQVDSGIANNVDLIMGQAFTNSGVPPIAEAAVDAGVPLTMLWTIDKWYTPQDAGDEFVQFFMPNAINNGYTAAKALFESMGGSGNIVHIEGVRGNAANTGRNLGLEKAMKEYPDINLLAPPQQGRWVKSEARKVMSDFVSQFGDKIDGVFGQNDAVGLGALTIAEENDLDVEVVGIDGIPEALQLVEEGRFTASVSSLGPWQGGWCLVKAHDFANGWRPKPGERMMLHGSPLLVKETSDFDMIETLPVIDAGNFNELIFEGDSTPYDWKKMSVVEAGEDSWDPQNSLVPIRKEDMVAPGLLSWKEDNRPSGYEIPSVYSDSAALDEVEKMYADHYQTNPLE
ncbi:sugar ABC transporter substrate-binding protein [Haloarchaeobius sp. TZWWS8]|uniref:sugar ABC transporter substrate-binding protein n=1 Tax=Haloarchaeobius sp. TZWWS8 TaxID=3446121 RepID=UPI003EBD15F7